MVGVHPGPWQGEPAADGNCGVARRRGEEAGGEPVTRGTRTALGLHAGTSLPWKAKSGTCPEGVGVCAAGVRGRIPLLPGEACSRDRGPLHVSGEPEVYAGPQGLVEAGAGVSRGRSSCRGAGGEGPNRLGMLPLDGFGE